MGAQDSPDMNEVGMQATHDSRPVHRVYVDAFWMDKNDVTNEEFARFVHATGYKTVAERKPRAEDFPGAPAENLVPGRPARLKLVNGTANLDYAGQAVANEIDGNVNVEVSMRVDPKLFALLKTGQSLVVEVAGKQATIPLKGIAQHLGAFESTCLGRR